MHLMTEMLQKQKQRQKFIWLYKNGSDIISRNTIKVKFMDSYPSLENDLITRVYITVAWKRGSKYHYKLMDGPSLARLRRAVE